MRIPLVRLPRKLWRRLGLGRHHVRDEFDRASANSREQLGLTLPRLERHFLDIGQCLEPLSNGSEALVRECETLLHLASGRENGADLLQDALAVLQPPLDYIDSCLGERDRLVSLLADCERQTGAMLRIKENMHDTLAPLAYLTVLFKIESARLPADMQETFATVTHEIERMRQLVDETFAKNASHLAGAGAMISSVRARLESAFKVHAAELVDKRGKIRSAIDGLDRQLAHNNERDLRLHGQSQVIAAEVGRMIGGLQFQDIVQQKCAHVVGELARADFGEHAHFAKLQASQLDAVCADLDHGLGQIRSGLENIAAETRRFDDICLKLDGLEGMVAAADGMVQLLLDVLADVGNIVALVSELTGEAAQTLAPMKDLASTLNSALVELSIDMQLIALNAQIRSVQGGTGTGLEQLAARTVEISRQTTDITTANYHELHILRTGIGEMLVTFGNFRTRGEEQRHGYEDRRQDVETRLHAMRDRTLDAFTAISGTLESIHVSAGNVTGALGGIPVCREQIAAVAAVLHELHARHGHDDPVPAGDLAVRQSYTMASQHAVHAAVCGTRVDPTDGDSPELFADPAPPRPAVAAAANDIGQNAELF